MTRGTCSLAYKKTACPSINCSSMLLHMGTHTNNHRRVLVATTTTLTPKQKQVKSLLKQGKTPTEVAKALKVNPNSVYQHIRRMKAAEGGAPAKPKRTAKPKSAARKSTTRKQSRPRPTPAPAPTPVAETKAMTPLQAIRHRKSEIESQITESGRRVASAEKVYNDEKDSHAKMVANRTDELKQLRAAEAALTGKKLAAKHSRSGNGNGSGSKAAAQAAAQAQAPAATPEPQSAGTPAPAPAQPDPAPAETGGTTGSTTEAPEPVEPPTGDKALAVVGAEQERPGVETVPEFSQEEAGDPFAAE